MAEGPRTLSSGARDLRVFLDGRLVFWKDGALVPETESPDKDPCRTYSKTIATPAGAAKVELSAHAFNVEDVKSQTARLELDNPRRHRKVRRRAFLVLVGIDEYRDPRFNPLSWAGADARALRRALKNIPDHHAVHAFVLARDGHAAPTRANLRAALKALAGDAPSPVGAPRGWRASTPDDLVLVSFSGHGFAEADGPFHLGMEDGSISEQALAELLRPVSAREMALIVDACQSAASVEGEDFKPGPLGSARTVGACSADSTNRG